MHTILMKFTVFFFLIFPPDFNLYLIFLVMNEYYFIKKNNNREIFINIYNLEFCLLVVVFFPFIVAQIPNRLLHV